MEELEPTAILPTFSTEAEKESIGVVGVDAV